MTEKIFGSEKKGSIQDIPLPKHEGKEHGSQTKTEADDAGTTKKGRVNGWGSSKRKNKRSRGKIVIAALFVVLLVGLYSWLFHHAQVDVVSKTQSATIANQEFTAAAEGEGLLFTRIEPISLTISSHIDGTQEENRQTKSSGTLTVYNTDDAVKNYIKNTRFETEDGRIYRAFQRFVIPKGTKENPGSVEVLVTAENPGEKYNSKEGLTFKLPALKENGDPDYDNISATQKTELSGGFSGVIKVPSQSDIDAEKQVLEAQIEKDLQQKFVTEFSNEFIVKDELVSMTDVVFTEKPNAELGGVDLEARAELQAVVFDIDDFNSFMAQTYIENYNADDEVVITNIPELTITIDSESFDPTTTEQLTFTVAGEALFQWKLVKSEIKEVVAGNLKSHVNSGLISGLQNASSVEASISPFWRRRLPQNVDDIDVVIK